MRWASWAARPGAWLPVGAVLLALALVGLVLALHGMGWTLWQIGTTNQPPCYAHVQGFHLPPGGHWC